MEKQKIFIKILQDVEQKFGNLNFDLDRLLPKEKNKKLIGLMKDELGG